MNCPKCGQLFCVCPQPDHSTRPIPPPHQYRPLGEGEYVTKEEFGLNLYEAIKTVGSILGVEQQRVAAIGYTGQGHKLQSLVHRRAELVKQWAHHRAILSHEELTQIIDRYPWVRDL